MTVSGSDVSFSRTHAISRQNVSLCEHAEERGEVDVYSKKGGNDRGGEYRT